MFLTIPVKLEIPHQRGIQTLAMATDIFSLHVDSSLELKTRSKQKLHVACYAKARTLFPEFPSGLVQTVRDVAVECLKSLEELSSKTKPKRKPTASLRLDQRNFSVRGDTVSVSLVGGRVKSNVHIPDYYREAWKTGYPVSAMLCYRKDEKQFWLNVVMEFADRLPVENGEVLGIDRGLINLAVLSNGRFYPSKGIRRTQRRILLHQAQFAIPRHSQRQTSFKSDPAHRATVSEGSQSLCNQKDRGFVCHHLCDRRPGTNPFQE
jgi:hypothetical protein